MIPVHQRLMIVDRGGQEIDFKKNPELIAGHQLISVGWKFLTEG